MLSDLNSFFVAEVNSDCCHISIYQITTVAENLQYLTLYVKENNYFMHTLAISCHFLTILKSSSILIATD